MDTRKFCTGFIKPDNVRDGPMQERIVNVYEGQYGLVLDLEDGSQFSLNGTNAKILSKAWGFESDDWRGKTVELSLGYYSDWKTDPPQQKETVVARPVSTGDSGNDRPLPPPRPRPDTLNDDIPF